MRTIDELRTQSNNLRYRYEIIENDSRCIHCNHLLTLRAFYVFPCGHHFHITCLTELVKPYLTTEQKSQLSKAVESQSENNASVTSFEDLFDEIIADDCFLCGHLAIENISKLYYDNQIHYETELSIWQ
uniref:SJCHGC08649 protein n=1 Tax=Schistosoma japonicum TaxID=6182 RepID=Q5D8Y5_SCHJA|nr:SJCHGC08649 protein [Schistosoma japonicum]